MASIDNITGWREEYENFQFGDDDTDYDAGIYDPVMDDWLAHKNKFVHGMPPKPPISQVLHLVDVMLGNEETRSAMKELSDWWALLEEKGPFEDDDPEMALFPDEAVQLLIEFWQWFCFKAGYPHRLWNAIKRHTSRLAGPLFALAALVQADARLGGAPAGSGLAWRCPRRARQSKIRSMAGPVARPLARLGDGSNRRPVSAARRAGRFRKGQALAGG